jgi:uncharacterized membrane protein
LSASAQASDPAVLVDSLLNLRPIAILFVGLVLLGATPIFGLIAAGLGFMADGEKLFSVISYFLAAAVIFSVII